MDNGYQQNGYNSQSNYSRAPQKRDASQMSNTNGVDVRKRSKWDDGPTPPSSQHSNGSRNGNGSVNTSQPAMRPASNGYSSSNNGRGGPPPPPPSSYGSYPPSQMHHGPPLPPSHKTSLPPPPSGPAPPVQAHAPADYYADYYKAVAAAAAQNGSGWQAASTASYGNWQK